MTSLLQRWGQGARFFEGQEMVVSCAKGLQLIWGCWRLISDKKWWAWPIDNPESIANHAWLWFYFITYSYFESFHFSIYFDAEQENLWTTRSLTGPRPRVLADLAEFGRVWPRWGSSIVTSMPILRMKKMGLEPQILWSCSSWPCWPWLSWTTHPQKWMRCVSDTLALLL